MVSSKVTATAKPKYSTPNSSLFTDDDLSNLPLKGESPYPSIDNIEVSEKGVFKLLQSLRPNKATGPDSIPAFILKTGTKELAPVLTSPSNDLWILDVCHLTGRKRWWFPSTRKETNSSLRTTDQSLSLRSPARFWSTSSTAA